MALCMGVNMKGLSGTVYGCQHEGFKWHCASVNMKGLSGTVQVST